MYNVVINSCRSIMPWKERRCFFFLILCNEWTNRVRMWIEHLPAYEHIQHFPVASMCHLCGPFEPYVKFEKNVDHAMHSSQILGQMFPYLLLLLMHLLWLHLRKKGKTRKKTKKQYDILQPVCSIWRANPRIWYVIQRLTYNTKWSFEEF